MSKPTVTLCMIVKDESHIIMDCLKSVVGTIDRYDITDTGSTDGTQEIIKNFFDEHNIPGEVYQSDWKGFGKSRTEAFENAGQKADYALIIDADDYLTGTLPIPELDPEIDGYSLKITRGEFTWWRTQLMKISSIWHYVGVLHEYATIKTKDAPVVSKITGDYVINARTEGNRNVGIDPIQKYSRDAEILLSALTNSEDPNYEPDNERYKFYLGQSYFDCQQWEKAEEWYQKRADAGGWGEEVFYSLLRVAMCKAIQEKPKSEIIFAFMEAHNARPTRAEPLYHLARIYREVLEKPAAAYLFAKRAAELPYPEHDILFITSDIYSWLALDELATCAHAVGDIHLGYQVSKKLLESNLVPDEDNKKRIYQNFKSYEQMVMKHQANMYEQSLSQKIQTKEQKKKEKEEKKTKVKKSTKVKSRKSR